MKLVQAKNICICSYGLRVNRSTNLVQFDNASSSTLLILSSLLSFVTVVCLHPCSIISLITSSYIWFYLLVYSYSYYLFFFLPAHVYSFNGIHFDHDFICFRLFLSEFNFLFYNLQYVFLIMTLYVIRLQPCPMASLAPIID